MSKASSGAQAFLLINPTNHGKTLQEELKSSPFVEWVGQAYGPFPVVAYTSAASHAELTGFVEDLRATTAVQSLDARMCKHIPGDECLQPLQLQGPELAVLLINVNYNIERERVVTCRLREIPQVKLARAMWGPSDIVAIVEERDHESMRNLICDQIKTMNGVATNTTLYCYPS